MKLWVRSQDKRRLIPNPNLYVVYDEKNECAYIGDTTVGHIGIYKTEERALEVLVEIEERITLINTLNMCESVEMLIGWKNALGEHKINGLCYPYQMPKE